MKKNLIIFLALFSFFPFTVFAEDSDTVAINVLNQSDVYTYDNYYISNFSRVEDGSVNEAVPYLDNRQLLVGRNCGINGRYPCGIYFTEDSDISSSGSIKRNMVLDIASPRFSDVAPLYGGGNNYSNYKNLVKLQFWTHKNYSHLQFNKTYQIALKVQKDSNLYFGGVNANMVHIAITDNDNPLGAVDVTSLVDKTARMVRVSTNTALIIINFKFDTNNHVYNFTNFSLNNISLDWISSEESYNGDRSDVTKLVNYVNGAGASAPFIIQNTSEEIPYYYKISNFYFLEDGFISSDGSYLLPDGTLSNELPDGYTTITDDELNIYDADVYCNPTDLMCHINNIIRNIKNVFERIGRAISSVIQKIVEFMTSIFQSIVSALQSLFIPSDGFINTFFSNQYQLLQSKLGILLSPFTIIGSLLNRFINLQANHVLSYNGFTFPFWNVQLIPPFSFDFIDFYSQKPELANLYNYYKIGITAIIYILFLSLCYKKFKNLIGGDSN